VNIRHDLFHISFEVVKFLCRRFRVTECAEVNIRLNTHFLRHDLRLILPCSTRDSARMPCAACVGSEDDRWSQYVVFGREKSFTRWRRFTALTGHASTVPPAVYWRLEDGLRWTVYARDMTTIWQASTAACTGLIVVCFLLLTSDVWLHQHAQLVRLSVFHLQSPAPPLSLQTMLKSDSFALLFVCAVSVKLKLYNNQNLLSNYLPSSSPALIYVLKHIWRNTETKSTYGHGQAV